MNPLSSQVLEMADVLEVNTLEDLQPHRMAWNALFQSTPRASFFHTYDWFVNFWQHYGQDRQMRVLIIRSGGTTVGIVPLCIITQRHRLTKLRVLTYPMSDWGMWYGPLGANRSATLFMALHHLQETQRDWDVIDFRWTADDPEDRDPTSRAMWAVGWKPDRTQYQLTSLVQFAGSSWQEYLAGLTKKWRHEIHRQRRKLDRLGTVEFIRHRPVSAAEGDGEPREDLFWECVEVARGSWQAQVTSGNTLCHESVVNFLVEAHRQAAHLGMLDLALLRVDGRPVAFQYNYHVHSDISGLRMGYLSELKDWGVGIVLLSQFLEDSFERGDQQLDLGTGDYEFKRRFRTSAKWSYRFQYAPWYSWRSQGVRLSHWLKNRFTPDEVGEKAKPATA